MKVCLLVNPKAGTAGPVADLVRTLSARHKVTVFNPADLADVRRHAAAAARGGFRVVAVAGGDGTVHAVVNALAPHFPKARLAVLPFGTGNDLCRTLAIPLDPVAAADLLRTGRRRKLDVVRVDRAWRGYMVNAAAGGFSGRVAMDVTADLKARLGPLAYLVGATGPVADPPTYRVTISYDGGPPETIDVLNVVVANGRTAAGGVVVAPTANPEDGLLDVVVVRPGDFLDRSVITARLLAGDYTADEAVTHRTAGRVEIASDPPMPFSIDGELTEGDRFVFTVVPRALRVLTGPDYRPDPRGAPVGRGGVRRWLFGRLAAVLQAARHTPRGTRAGLAAAVLLLTAFAWLAVGVTAGTWKPDDEAGVRLLRTHASPPLDAAAVAVTHLGDVTVSSVLGVLLAAVFLWRGRGLDAATLGVVLLGCGAVELAFKPAFALARPDLFEPKVAAAWHAFPSGHALRAVGLFGTLAGLLVVDRVRTGWRWAAAVGFALLAAGVCWSRVYLGVHWPTDVAAGALVAAAWVGAGLAVRHAVLVRRQLAAAGQVPWKTPAAAVESRC